MALTMLGIINATDELDSFGKLTAHRCLAALPFAGRYRLIDFMLSNMVNSGINNVAIFTNYETRSLMDHLESGKQWDLDRKRDGLFVFTPNAKFCNDEYNYFSHFAANRAYFERSRQQYVVVTNGNIIGKMEFCKVLDYHVETEADITEVYHMGESLNTFILKKELLLTLIDENKDRENYCLANVVQDQRGRFNVSMYEYPGFIEVIDSVKSYYETSLNLLERDAWKQLFSVDGPIFTKVKDEPPTKYMNGAKVANSMIANGCIIEGEVENSVIFRAVKIGKGSVIRNSIIMQKCQIEDNCILDGVIIDKDVRIEEGVQLKGSAAAPYIVEKGSLQKVH